MRTSVFPYPVEHGQIDVGEQRGDDPTLRGPHPRRGPAARLQHPGREPLPQQLQHPPVRDTAFHQGQQSAVVDTPNVVTDVGVQHVCAAPRAADSQRLQGLHCTALRFGRKPYETARKSASKMGSNTSVTAICTTRSRTVGIPSGRRRPSAFGMYRRRTGGGRYLPARRAEASSLNIRSTPYCSTAANVSPSTPAPPRLRFTRRHASQRRSALQTRSIRAWKRRSGDRLAATQSRRCNWRTFAMGAGPSGELVPVSPDMPSRVLAPPT